MRAGGYSVSNYAVGGNGAFAGFREQSPSPCNDRSRPLQMRQAPSQPPPQQPPPQPPRLQLQSTGYCLAGEGGRLQPAHNTPRRTATPCGGAPTPCISPSAPCGSASTAEGWLWLPPKNTAQTMRPASPGGQQAWQAALPVHADMVGSFAPVTAVARGAASSTTGSEGSVGQRRPQATGTRTPQRTSAPAASGSYVQKHIPSPGDRVASSIGYGLGTAMGQPANAGLRGAAVSVRWDSGHFTGDTPLTSLRYGPVDQAPPRTPAVPSTTPAVPSTASAVPSTAPAVGSCSMTPQPPLTPKSSPHVRPTAPPKRTTYTSQGVGLPQSYGTSCPPPMTSPAPSATTPSQMQARARFSKVTQPGVVTTPMPSPSPTPAKPVAAPCLLSDPSAQAASTWAGGTLAQPELSTEFSLGPASETEAEPLLPLRAPGAHVKRRSVFGRHDGEHAWPNPLEMYKRYSMETPLPPPEAAQPRRRLNSQLQFAELSQTVIVFDWDDTLFPTTALLEDFRVDWQLPVAAQVHLPVAERLQIESKLRHCEDLAIQVLLRSTSRGHVVIVTLARSGWVDMACQQYYPRLGEVLRNCGVPIVYALERVPEPQLLDMRARGAGDEEIYGLVKGRAISEEIERFYSQYEGQTWKNVLSVGDSRFERFGLLAAATAYMMGRRMSAFDLLPKLPGEHEAWELLADGQRLVRLRVKCCKLLERPDADELAVELDMLSRWLDPMTSLDAGFDLDVEALIGEEEVSIAEAVLQGKRPTEDMPKLS